MEIALITYPLETNSAGVGQVVRHTVRHLLDIDSENNYHLLHFTKSSDPLYRKNEIRYRRLSGLPVMFSDSWYLRNSTQHFNIVHRFSPGGFIFDTPHLKVVTLHDLFLYNNYPFNRKMHWANRFGRFFNRRSLLKADAILAVSRFTRDEAIRTFGLDPGKVHVVHNAPAFDPPLSTAGDDSFPDERQRLKDTYGLKPGYILFVGTIEPRKNLLGLVKAYERLKARDRISVDLVVVGQTGWDYQATLAYILSSPQAPDIKMMGFVAPQDLPLFYRCAGLFVYPSFMEGFGIPPLEAMQCGCPTLTACGSSFDEVVGSPEMMFDPQNIDEMAAKSLRLLTDPAARAANCEMGRKNVARFDWRASARKVMDIYKHLGERADRADQRHCP